MRSDRLLIAALRWTVGPRRGHQLACERPTLPFESLRMAKRIAVPLLRRVIGPRRRLRSVRDSRSELIVPGEPRTWMSRSCHVQYTIARHGWSAQPFYCHEPQPQDGARMARTNGGPTR